MLSGYKSWIVVSERAWSAVPKIFTVQPFIEEVPPLDQMFSSEHVMCTLSVESHQGEISDVDREEWGGCIRSMQAADEGKQERKGVSGVTDPAQKEHRHC